MFRRIVQSAVVTLAVGASALAADVTGTYSAQTPQGTFELTLRQDSGRLSGTVACGGQQLPIAGNQSGNQIQGVWSAQGRTVPFAASADGDSHLVLTTNGMTYDFYKGGAPAAQGAIDALAPVMKPAADSVQWHNITFSDNSGAVALPQGWQIVSVQNGCPGIFGPNGQIVGLGQKLSYSTNQVPYRGPVETAKVIWTQLANTFNPPVKFVQILGSHETPAGADGADEGDIRFIGDLGANGQTVRVVGHLVLRCTHPDWRGNWKGIYSVMLAPQDSFAADEATMTRIWNSWQINSQQVANNAQQAAVAELTRFRGQLAANAAQFNSTSHTYDFTGGAVAAAQQRMRQSGRQVEDFSAAAFGNNMSVDNRTGRVFSSGVNSAGDLNNATNTNNFSTFHTTPDP